MADSVADQRTWSIVLPVYNQADHLRAVVVSYLDALDQRQESYELLLVPNGCRDASEEICDGLAREFPHVRVVPCPTAGWGAAVRTGLAAATGERLCYTNLARTTGPDLIRILDAALANPDAAVKARRPIRDSLRRRLGSALYNLEAAALFGGRVADINGTPKAFPRKMSGLLGLRSDDDLIDLEFVAVCLRERLPLLQVDITSTERHGGSSTTGWRSAKRMYTGAFRLRWPR